MHRLLDAAGIPHVEERIVTSEEEALRVSRELGFPLVMKVVGPLHKSDVGGVVLNVEKETEVTAVFQRLMKIQGTTAVLLGQMASGTELYIGAKKETGFGHLVLFGMGAFGWR